MDAKAGKRHSIVGGAGWAILLGVAGLLVMHGAIWFFVGPNIALDNIAERVDLSTATFRQGNSSAFDIIRITARNAAILEVTLGALAMLFGLQSIRRGDPRARPLMWAMAAAIIAMAANFILVGAISAGSSYLLVALAAIGGLMLTRSGTE